MAEQIECVGGPRDGQVHDLEYWGPEFVSHDYIPVAHLIYQSHIYHYNPTTNTYQYKGVRK